MAAKRVAVFTGGASGIGKTAARRTAPTPAVCRGRRDVAMDLVQAQRAFERCA